MLLHTDRCELVLIDTDVCVRIEGFNPRTGQLGTLYPIRGTGNVQIGRWPVQSL